MSAEIIDVRQGPDLHRLEKQKLVRADWLTSESGDQAKYYSLTKSGRKHLAAC
jgi:PadR family transcriptional regulator PadR